MSATPRSRVQIRVASDPDRQIVYTIRHAIYAEELRQHSLRSSRQLTDALDELNQYIVAGHDEQLSGFISITPPASKTYSVDKYFDRSLIPFPFDEHLYEVRLLTVVDEKRHSHLALSLMYAAFRWVQSHGGKYIVAICRTDLLPMYRKAGLNPLRVQTRSGEMSYELAVARIDDLHQIVQQNAERYVSLNEKLDWQLPYPFFTPSACYHGGSSFQAIGEDLQTIHRARQVINADVLDAWFPPSPRVLGVLQDNLAWLLQTSPPTQSSGLIRAIAQVRGVREASILPGAGSSDLIFMALRALLAKTSRVLLLDPCYGEYAHVLEQIIQCSVSRFALHRQEGFSINTAAFLEEIKRGYDLVILVNPNSPTGVHLPNDTLQTMLAQIPQSTLVWIDETYIEFIGADQSMEQFAVTTENVIVCKSMSKVYALSGVRAAYLCSSPHLLENLKSLTPPWALSLPAQAAAIAALNDPDYYQEKYKQTHLLRAMLKQKLLKLGITHVVEGVANFLLFFLPASVSSVKQFLDGCQQEGLFLRDVSSMGKSLGANAIRIAVKDEPTINRMVTILENVLRQIQK